MNLIDKVKALFESQAPVILAETIFVKTQDGQIFLVKAPALALEAEIILVDEAGVEQPIENGDYILEDNSTISILDGKVAEIATAEEEATEKEVPVEAEEVILEAIPAGDYTLENGDVITIDENGVVINWVKAEVAVEEAPVEEEMEVVEAVNFSAINEELELKVAKLEAELKMSKEAFEKVNAQPASKPIDKKKFEKVEVKSQSTMLSKVSEIMNKNK